MSDPGECQLLTHSASYSVAGFRLRVGVESADLLNEAHALLQPFQVDSLASPAWRLIVRRAALASDADSTAGWEPIWAGEVAPQQQAVNRVRPGRRRLELIDQGRLDLDLRAQTATLTMAPHCRASVAGYFLMPLACEGLMRAGHVPVHAACLAVPSHDHTRSVLIVAKSGTGKSTTALALTAAGWQLMGDDLALICEQDGRQLVWGFPRMVHVRRPTLKLLPWLTDLRLLPHPSRETYDLPLAELGRRAWKTPGTPLDPSLLIILDRPNPTAHRCQPLDRAQTLAALAHENVQPIEGAVDEHAHAAFARFAALVQQAPAIRLSAGPQLDSLGEFLRQETGVGT